MVHGKQRETVVVVRRDEHEMGVVRARSQSFARLLEVGKLGVADLQDARQGEAFLVDILGVCGRSRLARDDFHAVGGFHRVERRNLFEVKKPTAPSPVVGVGSVQDRKVHGVRAVFDEVEPVVIVNPSRFQRSFARGVRQCPILRQRRRARLIRSQIGKNQSTQFSHRIRTMLHLLRELALLWFCRHLQALTTDIEQPAVIRAANPAIFYIAVFQRCSPMRAMETQKT